MYTYILYVWLAYIGGALHVAVFRPGLVGNDAGIGNLLRILLSVGGEILWRSIVYRHIVD